MVRLVVAVEELSASVANCERPLLVRNYAVASRVLSSIVVLYKVYNSADNGRRPCPISTGRLFLQAQN